MNDQRSTPDHDMPRRRSQGQIIVARALWYTGPDTAELRTERLAPPAPGQARVRTEFSAISRGTERLVAQGQVPRSEWTRMRAPQQCGDFSFPIKYGYSAAGEVMAGPDTLIGKRVFALHPHQDYFQLPESSLIVLPATIPTRRAVLAANMETALNAHWDAGTAPGDRLLVVGAGIVGLLIAYLARKIAGTSVTIADTNPDRAAIAAALGLDFADAAEPPGGNRIVFHTSATADGLNAALAACAFEGRVVELSWYGTRSAAVNLGQAFHAQRLQIVSSQVGHVAPSHRSQVSHRERLQRAVALLEDPALDALVSAEVPFDSLPAALAGIWPSPDLPPVVSY